MRYRDLQLVIDTSAPGVYSVFASGPGARLHSGTVVIDAQDPDLTGAIARIEARRTDADFLRRFGTELYHRLFSAEVGRIFDACYEEARAERDTGLRVRLTVVPAELAALPWEFLYHPQERAYLASLVQCPLVRVLQDARRSRGIHAEIPLRMLVCISELPPPFAELDTEAEKRALRDALGELDGTAVQVAYLEGQITEQNLSDALMDGPDCVHFIGHGEFRNGKGQLVLCGSNGGIARVDDDGLAALFRNATSVRFAFINVCHSATRSGTNLVAGLGPSLMQVGLSAVVAMQYAVQDTAAVLFAREFYRSFFRGANRGRVDYAMSHARNQMARHFPDQRELGTPVLFLRAEDGLVFSLPEREGFLASLTSPAAQDRAALEVQALQGEAEREDLTDVQRSRARKRRDDAHGRLLGARRAGVAGALGVGLAVLTLWISAFDRWDIAFERYTLWLGSRFIESPLADDIVFVQVTPELERRVGEHLGTGWRERHALVIEKLARAGARTIVFDMYFHDPDVRDGRLASAIEAAARSSPGTGVVLAYTETISGQPHVPSRLVTSGAHLGIGCYGRASGEEWARTIPLLARTADGYIWPSLALSAFLAHTGSELQQVDFEPPRRLMVLNPAQRTHRAPAFSETVTGQGDNTCSAIGVGDTVAELMISLPSLSVMRDKERVIDYGEVLEAEGGSLLERVRGRLVIVGAAVARDDFSTAEVGGEKRFGYELQASAISDLLQGRALRRVPTRWQFAVLVSMAAVGAGAGFLSGRGRGRTGKALLASGTMGYVASAVALMAATLWLLDGVYHLGATFVAYWFAVRGARRATRT